MTILERSLPRVREIGRMRSALVLNLAKFSPSSCSVDLPNTVAKAYASNSELVSAPEIWESAAEPIVLTGRLDEIQRRKKVSLLNPINHFLACQSNDRIYSARRTHYLVSRFS